MKIDWKQKLTSRKFWAAVTGFITALLVVLNVDDLTTQQVIGLVSAVSILVAYIFGEGLVDSNRPSVTAESQSAIGFNLESESEEE